jgi:hypothetical protein
MDVAVQEIFAKLKRLKAFDFYKTRTLTAEQHDWLELVCNRYVDASPEERHRVNCLVTPEISFLFFIYGKAMAIEAVRERDEAKVFKGLVALAVENQVFDWRDSLTVLTLLYHSAIKIGADASNLFQRVATISASQTSTNFSKFLARSPENRDIAKFGFKEGTDLHGNFAYVSK